MNGHRNFIVRLSKVTQSHEGQMHCAIEIEKKILTHQNAVTSTTESRKLMPAPSTTCEEGRDSRP